MEGEELTLKQKVDRIIEKEEDKKVKDKKFKLPFGIRAFGRRKLRKKNYAIVIWIMENGSVDIKFVPIVDNTIKVGDTYHDASAQYVLRYKQYPMIIQPSWNIKPYSSKEDIKKAVEEGSLSAPEKFIINKIEMERVKKSKVNAKAIGVIILVIVIGYFVASSAGWI